MSDIDEKGDEATENAAAIKRVEATQHGARGNVHSEPDAPSDDEPPPPLPN
ncbi:hypothetical protein [uncultured Sphingomonas sp.]|uniref:hypothetical protein n=1 Tax=uncultured Sphingomonas sp. TaxID=158754 RepID=UPI0035CB35E2